MAAAPADHALAAPGPIRPGSLRAEDLILLEDGHCLRDHALAACNRPELRRTSEAIPHQP